MTVAPGRGEPGRRVARMKRAVRRLPGAVRVCAAPAGQDLVEPAEPLARTEPTAPDASGAAVPAARADAVVGACLPLSPTVEGLPRT